VRAIDTNVLVRLLTRDDPGQAATAEAFVETGAWVSHLVLAEAVWVLTAVYELDAPAIIRAVEMALNQRSLAVEEPDVVAKALVHFRRRPALGLSDALVLEIARNKGFLPLGTFDRGLSRLPGAQKL
jgi:predicted nucleic-acid-binding protein